MLFGLLLALAPLTFHLLRHVLLRLPEHEQLNLLLLLPHLLGLLLEQELLLLHHHLRTLGHPLKYRRHLLFFLGLRIGYGKLWLIL